MVRDNLIDIQPWLIKKINPLCFYKPLVYKLREKVLEISSIILCEMWDSKQADLSSDGKRQARLINKKSINALLSMLRDDYATYII